MVMSRLIYWLRCPLGFWWYCALSSVTCTNMDEMNAEYGQKGSRRSNVMTCKAYMAFSNMQRHQYHLSLTVFFCSASCSVRNVLLYFSSSYTALMTKWAKSLTLVFTNVCAGMAANTPWTCRTAPSSSSMWPTTTREPTSAYSTAPSSTPNTIFKPTTARWSTWKWCHDVRARGGGGGWEGCCTACTVWVGKSETSKSLSTRTCRAIFMFWGSMMSQAAFRHELCPDPNIFQSSLFTYDERSRGSSVSDAFTPTG